VKAQIWDTSGAKEFLAITTTHYRFAVGAFLVYDVTNIQSFINLKDWLNKIREFSDPDVVIALVGNKSDLVEDDDRMNNYGKYASTYQQLDTEEDNENSDRQLNSKESVNGQS